MQFAKSCFAGLSWNDTNVPANFRGLCMQAIETPKLNLRYGIPGVAEVVDGNGGLSKVRVKSDLAEGEIYLHGAHVTSWKPAGAEEVIFIAGSPASKKVVRFAVASPSAFPGLDRTRPIPKLLLMDLCVPGRGSWNRSPRMPVVFR